jgi:hypothetical protein
MGQKSKFLTKIFFLLIIFFFDVFDLILIDFDIFNDLVIKDGISLKNNQKNYVWPKHKFSTFLVWISLNLLKSIKS